MSGRRPHRAAPSAPLIVEQRRLEDEIAARLKARAAAVSRSRQLLKDIRRPSSAPKLHSLLVLRSAPMLGSRPGTSIGSRPSARVLPFNGIGSRLDAKRSPWGFFPCSLEQSETHGEMLRLCPPELLDDSPPDIVIARPHTPQDKRLCFGPFAFRLSPSSEVLAWLMATTSLRAKLTGKSVLELGSGLGFTGIACAAWCQCSRVQLTDGDPAAVVQIAKNAVLNRPAYGTTAVDASLLLWGGKDDQEGAAADSDGLYDVILAADCVYDRQLHTALCQTIKRWIKPSGCAIVIASRRCGSLADFERCARGELRVVPWPASYDEAVTRRFRGQKCFPNIMTLVKSQQPA